MPEVITPPPTQIHVPEKPAPFPRITMGSFEIPELAALGELAKKLPDSDGVPLETAWHYFAMSLLIEVLYYHLRDRHDIYIGGNMFIYYSVRRFRNVDFVGPDFFFVAGVDRDRPREFWVVWEEEGRYPDVIIEILSETTAHIDRTSKKALYEKTFRTPEYFCFDPVTNQLEGWRLNGGGYQNIQTNDQGWLWSEVLQLWLGTWTGEYRFRSGTWVRFYDSAKQLILRGEETEHQRAETEHQRAETERQRAEMAEAELGRLKKLLAEMEKSGSSPNDAQQ